MHSCEADIVLLLKTVTVISHNYDIINRDLGIILMVTPIMNSFITMLLISILITSRTLITESLDLHKDLHVFIFRNMHRSRRLCRA